MLTEEHRETVVGTNGAIPKVRQLTVLDSPFSSQGAAHVRITKGGKTSTLVIPICSVDFESVEALVEHLRPRIPKRREKINNQWVTIIDEADETYIAAQAAYQRALSYTLMLMAMDVDIVDRAGTVVWSADNSVHDLGNARQALRDMGLVESQFVTLLTAIRNLTAMDEQEQEQD